MAEAGAAVADTNDLVGLPTGGFTLTSDPIADVKSRCCGATSADRIS